MNEELNLTLKEVEVQKLSLEPGDVLMVTIKSDDVDRASLNVLQKGFAQYFPNNKVMLFGMGTDGDVKLAIMKESVAPVQNLGYCSDCSCGKKERMENENG